MEQLEFAETACSRCNNHPVVDSFHDCEGFFDEVRFVLGTVPRSAKNRLSKKYQTEDIRSACEEFVENHPERVTAYKNLQMDAIFGLEETLWNS